MYFSFGNGSLRKKSSLRVFCWRQRGKDDGGTKKGRSTILPAKGYGCPVSPAHVSHLVGPRIVTRFGRYLGLEIGQEKEKECPF